MNDLVCKIGHTKIRGSAGNRTLHGVVSREEREHNRNLKFTYQMPWNGETVMNRDELNLIVKKFIDDLQDALHEPILEREIGDFPVDLKKAFFVMLPLMNEPEKMNKLKNIALAIGAIHAALDVHDRIHTVEATSAEQQLTVLAGDHFSGIHYRILAKNGEFSFIRELSKTIGHINEEKTALQNEYLLTETRLIERLTTIETACITSFYSVNGFDSYIRLMETILTYARLKELMKPQKPNTLNLNRSVIERSLNIIEPKLNRELKSINFLQPTIQQEILSIVNGLDLKS